MRSPSCSQWQTIYACKTHEITKLAIGIWSVNLRERSLGAETVRGLGVQTARLTGAYHGDERKRGITVAARCTLRGTTNTYTCGARHSGTRLKGTPTRSDIVIKTVVELKTVQGSDGKPHWQVGKWRHSFNVQGGANFHFDNLFNGNAVLADAVHQFANSNWRDVMSEVAPPVVRAIVTRVLDAIGAFYDHVPVDELALD
ncbi:hypothetical protein EVAR_49446_1 [Eumeta japonica]|uniref:Protein takeout n=1 Tax=Eumeta variegata TaxID=151549 RepID=A0A4C1Y5N7_EUMVA|nr:hypothetical protein EVAR_49446_1 [Eumeta japonica]